MEVILREDIEKVGHRGEVVKVAPGFARNFLLPKKLAVIATDANKKIEAANALKITAPDMVALGLVDDIIPEPPGGAHNDYDTATALIDQALSTALARSNALSAAQRLDARYQKFRRMGAEGSSFVDMAKTVEP